MSTDFDLDISMLDTLTISSFNTLDSGVTLWYNNTIKEERRKAREANAKTPR